MSPTELREALRGLETATLQTMQRGLISRSNEARNDIVAAEDMCQLHEINEELQVRALRGAT